jgi:hypothetical protein
MNDAIRWIGRAVTTPTGGVILGGVVTIIGGFAGSIFLARRDDAREQAHQRMEHAAAVKAVVFELSANVIVASAGRGTAIASTKAYDSLLLPLFHTLPPDVATKVALAYPLTSVVGGGAASIAAAQSQLASAQEALRLYAMNSLGLSFPPTN